MEEIKGLGIAEPLAEMLEILYKHPCAHEGGETSPCWECFLKMFDVMHKAAGTEWRATQAIYTAETMRFLVEHPERASRIMTDFETLIEELQLQDPDPRLARSMLRIPAPFSADTTLRLTVNGSVKWLMRVDAIKLAGDDQRFDLRTCQVI